MDQHELCLLKARLREHTVCFHIFNSLKKTQVSVPRTERLFPAVRCMGWCDYKGRHEGSFCFE